MGDSPRQWEQLGCKPLWGELCSQRSHSVPLLPHCEQGDPTVRRAWVRRDCLGGCHCCRMTEPYAGHPLVGPVAALVSPRTPWGLTGHTTQLPTGRSLPSGKQTLQGQSPSVVVPSTLAQAPRNSGLPPPVPVLLRGQRACAWTGFSAVLGWEVRPCSFPQKAPKPPCRGEVPVQEAVLPPGHRCLCATRKNDQNGSHCLWPCWGGPDTLRVTGCTFRQTPRTLNCCLLLY